MAWGTMFDNRFDYAAGIFNGTRNGYVDSNDFKDFAGLVNFRPFATWTDHPLENLNIGGSTDTGLENNVPDSPGLPDQCRHHRQPGDRPGIPGAQQERDGIGPAGILVDAHGVLLPAALA